MAGEFTAAGAGVGSAIAPGLGTAIGAGAGFLLDLGNMQANYYGEKAAAEQNQKYYRENMQANYILSQQAQRNAARNEVEGLRQAGLSPVLADGSAAAAVPSAEGGTMQNPYNPQVNLSNALLMSQLKLNDAQADKIKADAAGQEIKNQRDSHQDKSVSANLAAYYRDLAARTEDEELKAWFEESAAAAAKGEANLGDYEAMLKSLDLAGKPEEAIQRKLDRKITAWLAELRWKKVQGQTMESSDFVKALASLDVRQSDLLAAEASNIMASKKNADKMLELTEAKIKLTNEQITQVKAAAEAVNDQNIMHWIDKGEYGKAFLAGLIQIFGGFAAKGRSYATNE